jgi:putative ABC transport system ATP-binding protein
MLSMTKINKIYDSGVVVVKALEGIDLFIRKGEFVSIIGPSGSGKSTLMNIIGCLDIPTSGQYCLDGVEVGSLSDDEQAEIRNQKIGFVFQGFNLLTKLSALENVELPLLYRGVSAKERKERSLVALEKVGLGGRLHHRPTELSGGQQQRVAIARALAGEPPLILADEPTGNLDSKSGQEVLQSLQVLHRLGNTIILITHDQYVAEKAERVVQIQDGKIVRDERVGSDGV